MYFTSQTFIICVKRQVINNYLFCCRWYRRFQIRFYISTLAHISQRICNFAKQQYWAFIFIRLWLGMHAQEWTNDAGSSSDLPFSWKRFVENSFLSLFVSGSIESNFFVFRIMCSLLFLLYYP